MQESAHTRFRSSGIALCKKFYGMKQQKSRASGAKRLIAYWIETGMSALMIPATTPSGAVKLLYGRIDATTIAAVIPAPMRARHQKRNEQITIPYGLVLCNPPQEKMHNLSSIFVTDQPPYSRLSALPVAARFRSLLMSLC